MNELNGIVILNKPAGWTSNDCVVKMRGILRTKKVGHTGTLDPDVTGVLPICVGRATKIAEYITDAGKSYRAEVTIGRSTTTEDASGDTVEQSIVDRTISREELLEFLAELTGTIKQTPPMFSAVKVNGKRLYEYALKGQTVERPSRNIEIHSIDLLDEAETFSGDEIKFNIDVACGKGTYIRTLAVTIGEKLGYPAHMSKLVRTSSAKFTLENALTFEELQEAADNQRTHELIHPIEIGVAEMPKHKVYGVLAEKVKNGALLHSQPDMPEPTAVFDEDGSLLAIYQNHPSKEGLIKPVKIIKI